MVVPKNNNGGSFVALGKSKKRFFGMEEIVGEPLFFCPIFRRETIIFAHFIDNAIRLKHKKS